MTALASSVSRHERTEPKTTSSWPIRWERTIAQQVWPRVCMVIPKDLQSSSMSLTAISDLISNRELMSVLEYPEGSFLGNFAEGMFDNVFFQNLFASSVVD